MRPIPAALAALERKTSLAPRTAATIRRGFMRRLSDNYRLASGVDTDTPQMYCNAENTVYAAWRGMEGAARLNISSAGGLSATNAAQIDDGVLPAAMRFGIGKSNSENTLYVYRAITANGAWQLQRAVVGGTTMPTALAFSNFGPAFATGGADTAEYVRRIETIIPLSDGHVLVVDGSHQFTSGVSYLRFFLVDAWNAIPLRNVIEMPLAETKTTWRGMAKYCAYIAAAACAGGIVIVSNADPAGHAVTWTLQNGVESAITPLAPVDVLADNAHIWPCAITEINGVLYLTAHIERLTCDTNGTALLTQYDAYLTAAPERPGMWSFGGLGHYITPNRRNGTMLLMPGTHTGSTIVYVGNGSQAVLETTPEQYAAPEFDLLGRIKGWTLAQISDGADELSNLELLNGDGALNAEPHIVEDATLTLEAGHAGHDLIELGRYRVRLGETITKAGWGNLKVMGRDLGHAQLVDCTLPFSGMMRGRSSWRSDLKNDGGLTRKTPDRSWAIGAVGGLRHDGLNDPYIAMLDAFVGDDFLTEFCVLAECDDEYHQGFVGVMFGAVESADGKSGAANLLLVPKVSNWTNHNLAAPRLRKLNLGENGWSVEERMAPLVHAVGETAAISENAGAAYVLDRPYCIPAGVETEIAVRMFGEYVCVYAKRRDISKTGCAANARYELITRARFSRYARKAHGRRGMCGIALGHDVFASKTAFAGAFYKDMELQLNDAQTKHGARASAYLTPISGIVTEVESPPGSVNATVTGAGTKFTTELRVGQKLRFNDHVRTVQGITSDTQMSCSTTDEYGNTVIVYDRVTNGQAFIRSGDGYAWCTSAKVQRVVGDNLTLHLNPNALRTALEVGMAARISSDDNTAHSDRFVLSDGVNHLLVDAGWDATNPIPQYVPETDPAVPSLGYGGSEPNAWRIVGRASLIAKKPANFYGLPDGAARSRYMVCKTEIIRYEETSFTAWRENLSSTNYAVVETWLHVPTKFFLPAEQYGPVSAIAPNAGDPFGVVRAGDLLELTTRNAGDNGYFSAEDDKTQTQMYAFGKIGTSLKVGKYDAPLGRLGAANYEGDLNPRDMVITSGRGAFGTAKASHKPDEPVAYYPVGSDGKPAAITLKRAGLWSGRFITLQEAITRFCALAGMHKPAFRSTGQLQAALQANVAQTISNRDQSDFALDVAAPLTESWLSIYLRGYYRLDVSQPATGVISLRLVATQDVITAFEGERTLRAVEVPASDFYIAGDVKLRIIAAGTEIIVECAGQPLWTFDLETIGYVNTDSAPVQISSAAAKTISARLSELSGEVGDTPFTNEQTVNSIITDGLLRDRNVHHRATADGGVEYSAFWERDALEPLTGLILRDTHGGNSVTLAAHVQAIGDGASGEWVDDGVAAKYGYRFSSVRAGAVKTVAQAVDEARLYARRLKEQYAARSLDGFGILEAQAEDKINIAYMPGEGKPQLAPTDFVITKKTLTAEADVLKGSWDVRGFYDA